MNYIKHKDNNKCPRYLSNCFRDKYGGIGNRDVYIKDICGERLQIISPLTSLYTYMFMMFLILKKGKIIVKHL